MKVIHIYSNIDRMHGATKWLMLFASEIKNRGHDSTIYCPGFHIDKPYWLTAPIITTNTDLSSPKKRGRLARALNNLISLRHLPRKLPDSTDAVIMHAEPTVSLIPRLKRKYPKAQIIYYCYQPPREFYDLWLETKQGLSVPDRWLMQFVLPFYKAIDRHCVKAADVVLVWSDEYQHYAGDIYGSMNYVQVPAGVDFSTFEETDRTRKRAKQLRGNREHVLLMNAALIPKKRIEQFIYLIERLARSKIDIHGIVIGDGPLYDNLMALAKDHGVTDRFTIATQVSQELLPLYYLASDILVYLELAGAWSMSIIEAGAARIPVIVTSGGSMPTLVKNGTTGYILTENNFQRELDDRTLELLHDKDKRTAMGEQNHCHSRQFSLCASVDTFLKNLDEMAAAT